MRGSNCPPSLMTGADPKPGADTLSERGRRWMPNERVSPIRATVGGNAGGGA